MAKILIVEDNLEILEMLATVLGRFFEVDTFTNGKKALSYLRNTTPDLALLDVNVPVVDGFSLCKMIKEDPQTQHTKVVILTAAFGDEKGKELSQACGADHFFTKPVKTKILLQKIHDLLDLPFAKN